MGRSQEPEASALLAVYLERREDLRRYFTLRLGSAEAAEDLVQDIYFKVIGDIQGEIANPAAFLYRLGSNLMLDRLKQQRRALARDRGWVDARSTTLAGEEVADAPPADEALASRQRLERMLTALEELTPACRRAFRLHKLDGLSHAETAAAMGVSKSTIEKHISAALKHLLKRLDP
ncbi:MAG: sigma-70 family RNA polymerase sigma factor [Caulobacteraceae bacterium]|nr:sigma-70 family RNA polymerase sigma factor [Caulobacteraceae bacterium]